jgi:hypothetical protein
MERLAESRMIRLKRALRLRRLPHIPRAGVRIVTSSSAAVGCSAMVASKSALVALIFTAMPNSRSI